MHIAVMHSVAHFIDVHSPSRTARAHELVSGPPVAQFVITSPAPSKPEPGATPAAASI
jgi:hypothetical protein